MSSSPASPSPGGAIPERLQRVLQGRETLLVSSRDAGGRGRVRMWFALSPSGRLYLLTPSFSLKARRWADDPWVRVEAGGEGMEGEVCAIGPEEIGEDEALLLERFAMAGAVTREALRWMLESGSHRLLRVVPAPGGST